MRSVTSYVHISLCSNIPDLFLDWKVGRSEPRLLLLDLVQPLYLLLDCRGCRLLTCICSLGTALSAPSLWQVTHLQVLDDPQAAHLGRHHRLPILICSLLPDTHQSHPNWHRPHRKPQHSWLLVFLLPQQLQEPHGLVLYLVGPEALHNCRPVGQASRLLQCFQERR
jgi:hypothetical protein